MRKYTFIYIILFLSFFTVKGFSNGCPVGTYGDVNNITYYPSDSCAYFNTSDGDSTYDNHPQMANGAWWSPISCEPANNPDFTYYQYEITPCISDPVCPEGQANDLSSPTHECYVPESSECPEFQHDINPDIEILECVCDNNLPKYFNDNGDMVCQVAECPINYNGKALRQQNQDYAACAASYPLSLYDREFITDVGISCCFATGKNLDDNSTPPAECPAGMVKNNNNECVEEIPPSDPSECPAGQEWDNFTQSCIDTPDASSEDDGSGGASSDGTDYNDTSSPYSGGANGAGDEGTQNVILEYSSQETTDILEGYGGKASSLFKDNLNSYLPELTSLYKISIPTIPSCGCNNIDYSLSLLNHAYSGRIDICSPLQSLFDFVRPLLWFFFLLGLLFTFLRGD